MATKATVLRHLITSIPCRGVFIAVLALLVLPLPGAGLASLGSDTSAVAISAAPMLTLTLYAGQDSWIDAENGADNHGADVNLEVGRVGGRTAYDHQTLVRFDLTVLPVGSEVTAARLQLYQHDAEGADDGYGIWPYAISGRWSETIVTWENKPSAVSLDDPPTYPTLRGGWKEWSVTGIARYWTAQREANHGILLRGDGDTLGRRAFYAREYRDAAPRLIIDYIPPDPTSTPTRTRTPSATATATHTRAPTATATRTRTPTPAPPSATFTRTPTAAATRTRTPSATATVTRTPTVTAIPCNEVQVAAAGDSWNDQNQPNTNHGADTALVVGKRSPSTSNRVALVHFDVNTLPDGAWIQYAWMELYHAGASGPAQLAVRVDALMSKWGESSVTWANMPAAVDTSVPPLAVPLTTAAWRRWNVTELVQRWAAGDGLAAGVKLRGDGVTEGTRTFAARESATPPRLTICYFLDTTPPDNPHSFTADHFINQWSNNPWVSSHWDDASDGSGSGVYGFSVEWSNSPTTVPDDVIDTITNQGTYQLTDGPSWYFHVRTRDIAGNWNAGASHFGPYKIDLTPPSAPSNLNSGHTANQWTTSRNVWVNWAAATDSGSGMRGYAYQWDQSTGTIPPPTVNTTDQVVSRWSVPDGSHWLHVRAVDWAGNGSVTTHYGPIQIDNVAPTTQLSAPAQVANKTFTVSWAGSDTTSGVHHYEVRYRDMTAGSSAWQTWHAAIALTSASFTGQDGHRYLFQARAYDQAGNVRSWSESPQAETAVATVDFIAIGLEVTQGIQDMSNSVRLVQDKRTFARLHVKAASGNHGPVKAQLNLYRNGQFVQAILASNPNGSITVRQSPDRGQLGDSFYFDLPSSWLHGTITLEGRISFGWAQTNSNNDTASATVSFEYVPRIDVTLVDVGYSVNGTSYSTPWEQVFALESWLKRIYPIPGLNPVYGWMCCFTAKLNAKGEMTYPGCGDVNSDLRWHKANNSFGTAAIKWSRTYGMVNSAGKFMRGCSDLPGTIGSGPSWLGGEWYGSHELGHSLNQVHTKGDSPAPCGDCTKDACGPWGQCGCEGGAVDHGRNGDISLTKSPYAGTTFYGFDIETLDIYPPTWKENMSYCNPEWISDYTYESIMDRIQWEGSHAAAAEASAPGEYLAVFGTVVTATQQVTLDTFYRLPNATDLIDREPGPYSVRLLGSAGAQLADYPFTPRWSHQDPGPSCAQSVADAQNPAQITEYVPWVEGTRRIAIFYGGQELASRTVSSCAPAVTLLTPNGGAALTGETVTVAWSASDADGDALEFSVEYSMDGGASWRMVRSDLTATQAMLPLEKLGGTTQGKFRVLATDGVNTGMDASDGVFSVPDKTPALHIASPATGAHYIPGQSIALIGQAMDVEDGALTGDALQWMSSVSGALGVGEMLHVTDLPEGLHTITLAVQDQGGHRVEESVTILVADLDAAFYLPLLVR